jgi:hypothetical protein
MKNDRNTRGPMGSALNLGARIAQRPRTQNLHSRQLETADAQDEVPRDQPGNDPYNTSGSFDRKKNWERVGKR